MVFENLNTVIKTDRSAIPAGCLSFAEQTLYIAEATESEFNKLFESVGIDELAVFESSGTEVVYEGAKLEEFKNKAIEFFKSIWSKIKHSYELITDKFEAMVKGTKKNLSTVKAEDIKKLNKESKFGKIHTFDFGGNTAREAAHKLAIEIKDAFYSNANSDEKTDISQYQDRIIADISGTGKTDMKEAKAEFLKKRISKEEKDVDLDWVKNQNNLDTLQGVVFNSPKKEIKESLNAEKTIINEIIGEIKKFKSEDVNSAKTTIALFKDLSNTLSTFMHLEMDIRRRRYNEYKIVFTKVYLAIKKASKVTESVEDVVTSQQDLVESCFDWD